MMDAKIKAKWIAALRSGSYQQGTETLRAKNKYCCLGVLCDVDGAEWRERSPASHVFIALGMGDAELEGNYCNEIGISKEEQDLLMAMNDGTANSREAAKWGIESRRHTFAEIADWVEEHL